MLEMICAFYTFHQYIVNVYYFRGTPDQIFEDFVNYSLKGCPRLLESEGHHLIAVDSSTSKDSFVFIWWVHLDLIVAGIGVYEAKELMARCRLY